MKKRNILVIILILLMMICVVGYIFTLQNSNLETNNDSYNNSTNPQLNKSSDKNIGMNNTNLSKNDEVVNYDLNSNYNDFSSSNNHGINKKDFNYTNDSYDEAMEAKKAVERYVLDKNEIAGYPTFKDKDGSWLVPIFDKKTKKFISSVYVYVGHEGNYYVSGPQVYSEYKDIISGKTTHKVDSKYNTEYGSDVVEEVPDYSMRYVLAASNPNGLNSQDILVSDQLVFDEECFPDSDHLMSVSEYACELNSTG